MPQFDADTLDSKTLDSEIDGAALLAAVLYPSARDQAEARERGRQRMARAGSFAEAFAAPPVNGRAMQRNVKLA